MLSVIPLNFSVSSTLTKFSPFNITSKKPNSFPSMVSPSSNGSSLLCLSNSGICRASEVADLFPAVSPEIVVREARLEDYWEVVETHCKRFFPEYSFPLDFVLRIDRLVIDMLLAMLAAALSGLFKPRHCRKMCLVAVIGTPLDESVSFGTEGHKIGYFDGKFSLNKDYVVGILTVDNIADFLPRKGPQRHRRTGIAYISNLAVRENFKRKGIATKLVEKAESHARSWNCRAMALHCDIENRVATMFYKGHGYKCVKVPEGAKWPEPMTSTDMRFNFMMKLLKNSPP
ncbi:Acyl-CoA N-acyltransferase [Vigna unguiculata]|uniref:Acyl-CoA N-acyltransferase n=1 Tax=Vigna unguiculata TaxID=3917 RepID=A0A4D6LZQ7_VIGUN|nr:Acyl-CoA N-acyltransferase [Vigna unguiculata]QCD94265.1 Acyl-CoA N-acyltransferase [Vigna unguiculata]